MSRVKHGVASHKRHKRVLKQAKGFWGQRQNIFRRAQETVLRAMANAFKSRKLKKRDMRALFITRINAEVKKHNFSYSAFIHGLNTAKIELNRKVLSQLAIFDPEVFEKIVVIAKGKA